MKHKTIKESELKRIYSLLLECGLILDAGKSIYTSETLREINDNIWNECDKLSTLLFRGNSHENTDK